MLYNGCAEEGTDHEEQITRSCNRLYTTRFLLGLFDGSEYDSIPYEVVECEGHENLRSQRQRKESFFKRMMESFLR